MVEILIRGEDAETFANQLDDELRELFGAEPIRTASKVRNASGTRGLVELALIILALPPAALGTTDLLARSKLGERLGRLLAKVAVLRKTSRSTVLIDPGDGKHIPLEEANREAIVAALKAIEQRLKP